MTLELQAYSLDFYNPPTSSLSMPNHFPPFSRNFTFMLDCHYTTWICDHWWL